MADINSQATCTICGSFETTRRVAPFVSPRKTVPARATPKRNGSVGISIEEGAGGTFIDCEISGFDTGIRVKKNGQLRGSGNKFIGNNVGVHAINSDVKLDRSQFQ